VTGATLETGWELVGHPPLLLRPAGGAAPPALPAARGRGYGAALTWRAALTQLELPAVLLASDDGRARYECMGFLPLLRFTLWLRRRPTAPATARS
jgi:hypothetical protein